MHVFSSLKTAQIHKVGVNTHIIELHHHWAWGRPRGLGKGPPEPQWATAADALGPGKGEYIGVGTHQNIRQIPSMFDKAPTY